MPRTRPDEDVEVDTLRREADTAGREPVQRPEPPAPLPPRTEDPDSVDGEKPHRTCSDGTTTGGRRKSEVG